MKKYFIILAAAALALSACSKVEVTDSTPDQKITFQTANYVPGTKADSYVSLLGDTKFFKSKAFLHAEGMTTVQNFFGDAGETITANDDENPSAWVPSHDYFWPKSKNSYINFVSWFDKNGAPTTSTETSLAWTDRTIAVDDNIMWADEAWRYNQNTTSLANNTAAGLNGAFGQDAVTEGVPTLFHHALAKLAIKAKADPVEKTDANNKKTTWTVTLEGIKITNTFKKGTLSLTNSDLNSTGIKAYSGTGTDNVPAWATSGTAEDITMSNTSALTAELAVVLAEQSVLPQTLADAAELSFTLHIITKYDGTQYSEEKIPVKVPLNSLKGSAQGAAAITAWQMNHKYTYNIIVNPETTTVKFDPAVIDWVVESDAPTYSIPAGQI